MAAEVLFTYVELLPLMSRRDLPTLVATARRTRFRLDEPAPEVDVHRAALRLGWIVQRVVGIMPADRRCLIRSLVLLRVLARRAIPAQVVIGVRSDGSFSAHAWVEHAGRPVLPAGAYERLVDL